MLVQRRRPRILFTILFLFGNEAWKIVEHVYAAVNYQWLPHFYCQFIRSAVQCYLAWPSLIHSSDHWYMHKSKKKILVTFTTMATATAVDMGYHQPPCPVSREVRPAVGIAAPCRPLAHTCFFRQLCTQIPTVVVIWTSHVIQRNFWWRSGQGQVIFDEVSKPVLFIKVYISDYEFSQHSKYIISFLLRLLDLPEFTSGKWHNALSTIICYKSTKNRYLKKNLRVRSSPSSLMCNQLCFLHIHFLYFANVACSFF